MNINSYTTYTKIKTGLHALPLLGHVRAGFASPAEEDAADLLSLDEYLLRDKDASYLLRVVGNSMEGAGILEGDLVVFERTGMYKPGDIVIALTEDGYTIKYLRKERGHYFLEAAHADYPRMHPKEGQIIGVVTGSFRKYA